MLKKSLSSCAAALLQVRLVNGWSTYTMQLAEGVKSHPPKSVVGLRFRMFMDPVPHIGGEPVDAMAVHVNYAFHCGTFMKRMQEKVWEGFANN